MSLCSYGQLLKHVLWSAISNAIKGIGFPHWTPIDFSDPTNGIRARVIGSILGSVTLSEGLLECNSAALLTWTGFRTCFVGCDFECHKRRWLPSLDINWFSGKMVKGLIQQIEHHLPHELSHLASTTTLHHTPLSCT
jgi:hypothetical protein